MSLVSVAKAHALVTNEINRLGPEAVTLDEASNRILAEDLSSRLTQPPFNSAAMDGYAVRADDVKAVPATLTVTGEAAAGHGFDAPLGPGEAVRIFTGAPLPDGADTIIIQENTKRDGNKVAILEAAPKGQFVRPRGMDFCEGETLIHSGTRLTARHLNLAAAMNHPHLNVVKKPRVAILATGDELVPPGQTPAPDQIISSVPYGLCAMIEADGGLALPLGIAKDTEESLLQAMSLADKADILITIGGASAGDHDLVQQALRQKGVELGFWKIAMRPGKPLMYGRLGPQRVLGLPGNPVSAMICARIFLIPMIRRLLGCQGPDYDIQDAYLGAPLPQNGPRQHYMRGQLSRGAQGTFIVLPASDQDSALQAILAGADCLIIRSPNAGPQAIGEKASIMTIDF